MRTLIIGCGYVGLELGKELADAGHEVYGVSRHPNREQLQATGIKPLAGDITKPEQLTALPANYDWVINCVSSAGGDIEDYRAVYLEGTRNLLRWLEPSPPQKFVYTSSTSIYGQMDGSVVDEDSPSEPTSDTAKVLVAAEKLLSEAAARSQFPAVILRVAGIYGPERGYWFRQYLRNEARIEGDGSRFLNMIHRDDVAATIIAALNKGCPGEVYNAVDDEPVTQLAFFQWLAKQLGKDLPPTVPESSTQQRKRGITNKKVSNRKLKNELGYQFKYPTFREGYAAEIA
jgi:nucleoside-diphosphate-sugar epimerase